MTADPMLDIETERDDRPTRSSELDPLSDYSLHDVVDGSMPVGGSTEYRGLHICAQGNDVFHLVPDGHVGYVAEIQSEQFDDVLGLVNELNRYASIVWFEADRAWRIENCGRLITSDPARKDNEDYVYVSRDDTIATRSDDAS